MRLPIVSETAQRIAPGQYQIAHYPISIVDPIKVVVNGTTLPSQDPIGVLKGLAQDGSWGPDFRIDIFSGVLTLKDETPSEVVVSYFYFPPENYPGIQV